jgi:integrase
VLAAYQGARERAILHLTWDAIDLARGAVTWRARFDKTGVERVQPLTLAAYCALLTARWWRGHEGRTSPWVFPSPWAQKRAGREEPGVYGAQALWLALRKAEDRAEVLHRPFRAVHGFRR